MIKWHPIPAYQIIGIKQLLLAFQSCGRPTALAIVAMVVTIAVVMLLFSQDSWLKLQSQLLSQRPLPAMSCHNCHSFSLSTGSLNNSASADSISGKTYLGSFRTRLCLRLSAAIIAVVVASNNSSIIVCNDNRRYNQ